MFLRKTFTPKNNGILCIKHFLSQNNYFSYKKLSETLCETFVAGIVCDQERLRHEKFVIGP